jgi:hypothetical protein
LHSNDDPASVDEKVKLALDELLGLLGDVRIDVSGGVVSVGAATDTVGCELPGEAPIGVRVPPLTFVMVVKV